MVPYPLGRSTSTGRGVRVGGILHKPRRSTFAAGIAGSALIFVITFVALWQTPRSHDERAVENWIRQNSQGQVTFVDISSDLMSKADQDALIKFGMKITADPVTRVHTRYKTTALTIPGIQSKGRGVMQWTANESGLNKITYLVQNGGVVWSWPEVNR